MPEQHAGDLEKGQPESDLVGALRDCLVIAVMLVDPDNEGVTLSGRAARILGLGTAQQARCALAALPAPVGEVVREALSSRKEIDGRQVEWVDGGGQARKLHLSALRLAPGTETGPVAFIVNDAAPGMELERKLRQLERLANVGTLSASMAHEIRNGLVAARTFTELLLEANREAELAALARRELERVDSIVGRMLKFSGPVRLAGSAISLHETLEHSLRLVQRRLEEKSITVNRHFGAAPGLVQGEDMQLQQAFLNLFLNALDAMEPKGTLTVTTRPIARPSALVGCGPGPTQIGVTVHDTGAGISPENLARLFEPFFTTKPNGTGLGLSITRRIIHQHQGGISIQSQPGKGTAVEIVLPAAL
ncbi:MAG: two-component system sensor histidine kinase NtrB [Limisphaerales bacterium]